MSRNYLAIGLLSAVLITIVHSQDASPPASASHQALIERMRAAALSYSEQLKDFTCLQLMTRGADDSGTGNKYKLLETQELELGYINHTENYKLLKVNGSTANVEKKVKQGYFKPSGEFGTDLQKIFEPKANAEFTWDHEEPLGGARSCVFRYNVPVATTTLVMRVNLQKVPLGHHGFVYADCETGAVTRFRWSSDVPTIVEQGHKIQVGEDLEVRYAPVTIDSKEFLLPQSAESVARFYKRLTKSEIQFQQYRKYDSSSNITFDKNQNPE